MAMLQRDDKILRRSTSYGGRVEEIKRLDALLEYAVMHGDYAVRLVECVQRGM